MSSDPWADLANSLRALCDEWDRSRDEYNGGFRPGSLAAAECAAEPMAGDWGDKPGRDATVAGSHLALMAMDHLSGLSALLRADVPAIYAPAAVARSSLEISAKAWYLLDPAIGQAERVRRYNNNVLSDLVEKRRLAECLDADSPEVQEALQGYRDRTDRILRAAQAAGLTIAGKTSRAALASAASKATPSSDDLIVAVLQTNDARNSKLGSVMWRQLSAAAHGAEHGFMRNVVYAGHLLDTTSGDAAVRLESDPRNMGLQVLGAPFAAIAMLQRLYAWYGWPAGDLVAVIRRLLLVWARILKLPSLTAE